MFDKLVNLRKKGYTPDIIFDIGAHHGNWTLECLKIYPKSRYILIEPIEYQELNNLKKMSNVRVFNNILNDSNKEVDWYELKNTGDSIFKEKSKHFIDCIGLKKNSITLNTFLENKKGIIENCNKIMIKIDCQGAEIPILKGASDVYEKVDFIILELPLFGEYNENVPSFFEHIKFMDSIGFIPYDIIDNHYINGFNMQVDILFINKNHNFNIFVQELLLK
jgi:FkbM family methyltransferase